MRRKDLLIIVTAFIVISFLAVFGIYYIVNDGELFTKVKEGITEIAKGEYHSNGWSTSIVDKIVDNAPIPVGFTYIEGDSQTGIIVKQNETNEKYMWIPADGTVDSIDFEVSLEGTTREKRENILEYGGFYVEIERVEERFEKQANIAEISIDEEDAVEDGLEGENMLEVATLASIADDFETDPYANIETNDKTKLDNYSRTSIIETNTMTQEELASIKAYSEKIGKNIILSNYKTATILGVTTSSTGSEKATTEEKIKAKGWSTDIIGDIGKDDAPIPKGFTYIEETEKTDGKTKTVAKIKNRDNLYFIWIPVKNVEGETGVKETFLKNVTNAGLDEKLVIEPYNTYKDEEGEEYNALVESIKKYGGFYISEAELGYDDDGNSINIYREMYENEKNGYHHVSNGDYYRNVKEENKVEGFNSKEGEPAYFELTYKNAKEKCEELYKDSTVVSSHLTYGLEYDAVVNYLIEKEIIEKEKAFNDSTEIGKYSNSDKSTVWKNKFLLNGVYGLGGNLAEITQEKDGENIIVRGGSWNVTGKNEPLATKVTMEEKAIEDDEETIGFRACLYIKTEYDEKDLKEVINKRITNIKQYINRISIKLDGNDKNFFDNEHKEGTEEYKNKSLANIVDWARKQMEKETSSAAFSKIETDAKKEVDVIKDNIVSILTYASYNKIEDSEISKTDEIAELWEELGIEGEKITINDICFRIKEKAVEEMQELVWQETLDGKIVVKDKNGKETSYASIRIEAEENIEKIAAIGKFAGGSGTKESPYLISTREQLEALAETVNSGDSCKGKYYKIINDIDLGGKKWTPIGKITPYENEEGVLLAGGYKFSGNLDGDGHKISNIWVEEDYGAGLIGNLDGEGEVKNIIIESGIVQANKEWAAGIVVWAKGSYIIDNCENKAEVICIFDAGYSCVGGIVGRAGGSTKITNCKNHWKISTNSEIAGGIAGELAYNVKITNCENKGEITADKCAGGIVGVVEGKVEGCTNEGKVTSDKYAGGIAGKVGSWCKITGSENKGEVTANAWAGGIAGKVGEIGIVENCVNEGKVTANAGAGGICGDAVWSEITGSENKGEVTANDWAGGIVGCIEEDAKVENCINEGKVTAKKERAGGIVGEAEENVEITNCTNKGEVVAEEKVAGGIVGIIFDKGKVEGCTNEGKVTANAWAGGIAGKVGGWCKITGCENSGEVVANNLAGGIAGIIMEKGKVEGCTNKGKVTANEDAGGIAGHIYDNATITGSENKGEVVAEAWVGGIVGTIFDKGKVEGCTNEGKVTANAAMAGGIAGSIEKDAKVENCVNEGKVTANAGAGGISGQICDNGTITGSENKGEVVAEEQMAGGIAGNIGKDAKVENCVNEGKVTAKKERAGGIVVYAEENAEITNCTNKGEVVAEEKIAGGIAGSIVKDAKVENCVNEGKVTAKKEKAGGIVGYAGENVEITNCTNKGEVTSDKYAGGIVGFDEEDGTDITLEDCKDTNGKQLVGNKPEIK